MIENNVMAGGLNKHWVRFLIRIFMHQVFTSPCTVLLLCDILKDGEFGRFEWIIVEAWVLPRSCRINQRSWKTVFLYGPYLDTFQRFSGGILVYLHSTSERNPQGCVYAGICFFWSNVVFELRIFSPGGYCFQRELRSYWDGARFDEIPS